MYIRDNLTLWLLEIKATLNWHNATQIPMHWEFVLCKQVIARQGKRRYSSLINQTCIYMYVNPYSSTAVQIPYHVSKHTHTDTHTGKQIHTGIQTGYIATHQSIGILIGVQVVDKDRHVCRVVAQLLKGAKWTSLWGLAEKANRHPLIYSKWT